MLAINATLEATKHKQAKEIRELRRKLRESRLILPPPAFRAVSSLDADEHITDDDEEEEDNDDHHEDEKGDEAFKRVKTMIETLLEAGKAALETKADDFIEHKNGTKVLHEVEARSWREGTHNPDESVQDISISWDDSYVAPDMVEQMSIRSASPSLPSTEYEEAVLSRSEDEVEDLIDEDDEPKFGSPPITVTYSP